jgi:small subunit ribosomal protein S20
MANIKSAEKRIKQTAKRQLRNRGVRTHLRTKVKGFRQTEASKKAEALPEAYAEIDRAWKKGVIHKNAASRYKSRLARAAGKSKV